MGRKPLNLLEASRTLKCPRPSFAPSVTDVQVTFIDHFEEAGLECMGNALANEFSPFCHGNTSLKGFTTTDE